MADPLEATGSSVARDFVGKVALVVGASKGIGADTARKFAERGANVVLASRDIGRLDQLATQIREACGHATVVATDLSDDVSVAHLGSEIREKLGRLDMAFNNAGEGYQPTDLVEIPTEAFDRVFQVTVRGTFLAMKQEIPLMLRTGGGAIVNMSSTAGMSAFKGGSPYVAAKHAILGLTKTAALDYAQRNVRVNAVAPGPIETDRMRDLPESYKDQARQAVPMRRLGTGNDVAESVLWLCSDAAHFVTGTTLTVDGGRLAGWG
jgi:NAD(P)-dependent dehydrogenase (short-subunit alcohol dehydrogenase family)